MCDPDSQEVSFLSPSLEVLGRCKHRLKQKLIPTLSTLILLFIPKTTTATTEIGLVGYKQKCTTAARGGGQRYTRTPIYSGEGLAFLPYFVKSMSPGGYFGSHMTWFFPILFLWRGLSVAALESFLLLQPLP